MPPKKCLTREAIIQCAFEQLRREGYESLNARGLASALGCSTMSLFRHFGTMEEIRSAAVDQAVQCYSGYIRQGLSEPIPFKGVGRAYIRFAREEPRLFQLFFMTPNSRVQELSEEDPNYRSVALAAQQATGTDLLKAEQIFREMWIFVHGIATLIVTKKMTFDEEELEAMLSHVFAGLKQTNDKVTEEKEKREERHE